MNYHFIAFLALAVLVTSEEKYKKIVHNVDPEARCLDGSPAMLYLHEGNPKNIMLYFMSGGSCSGNTLNQTYQHCYQRSRTAYGSSLYWPETKYGQGILSTDSNKNIFANWTKVIMIYCDGSFHQGFTKQPYKYKDSTLYFRGGLITKAHLKYVNDRYNFANAENVILTGSSAGAMATYIWADHLKGLLTNPNTKYFPIVDSGIFLDPNFNREESDENDEVMNPVLNDQIQTLVQVTNKDEPLPNKDCVAALGKENQWRCLNIQSALPYLGTESLFINSAYDAYVIISGAGIRCPTEGVSGYSFVNCGQGTMALIEGYRQFYMKFIFKLLEKGHNIWSIACSWHSVQLFDKYYESPLQKVPMTSGKTIQEAIYSFVFEGKKIIQIDVEPWPSNSACAF